MSTWATPKEQRLEAIKRLEMWQDRGLKPSVLNAFKRGQLYVSDRMILGNEKMSALFPLKNNNGSYIMYKQYVKEFESFFAHKVYHIIHDWLEDGTEVLFFLYVTVQFYEWEMEREDIEKGLPFVYARDVRECRNSQFGNIETIVKGGGIVSI